MYMCIHVYIYIQCLHVHIHVISCIYMQNHVDGCRWIFPSGYSHLHLFNRVGRHGFSTPKGPGVSKLHLNTPCHALERQGTLQVKNNDHSQRILSVTKIDVLTSQCLFARKSGNPWHPAGKSAAFFPQDFVKRNFLIVFIVIPSQ